ncbi:hypothetical protein MLD38_019305 [Melastoma candidum]|uniref:Uncharacterized protein n=1 Tax=Melastoma candidum TaxID=119954 RepID=A0ACB9R0M2_9MYRT|nr:hypothetical protein MLD38_019305 [Melastoma candidum]
MGSGDWIKSIISLKKAKSRGANRLKAPADISKSSRFSRKSHTEKEFNGTSDGTSTPLLMLSDDRAAIRIQTAFRAYAARKALQRLKRIVRMQKLTQRFPVQRQAVTTLGYLHSWSKIQAQVRARRLSMVTEGRMRQKKLENQMKLEAKLHELEVDWCGGSESMDEILAKIHQKEEAAVKRERAMAYAFNHQWRANSNSVPALSYEVSKANLGWSWMDRWIAAQPWEVRTPISSISPRKTVTRQGNKGPRGTTPQTPKSAVSLKPSPSKGKAMKKGRRLSFPNDQTNSPVPNIKLEETDGKTPT